jgi:hypothetical protein
MEMRSDRGEGLSNAMEMRRCQRRGIFQLVLEFAYIID